MPCRDRECPVDLAALRSLFGWCALLNGGLLTVSALVIRFAHAQVFLAHSDWVTLSKEGFDLAIYLLLGIWKLLVIVFNLIPYLALVIILRVRRQSSLA